MNTKTCQTRSSRNTIHNPLCCLFSSMYQTRVCILLINQVGGLPPRSLSLDLSVYSVSLRLCGDNPPLPHPPPPTHYPPHTHSCTYIIYTCMYMYMYMYMYSHDCAFDVHVHACIRTMYIVHVLVLVMSSCRTYSNSNGTVSALYSFNMHFYMYMYMYSIYNVRSTKIPSNSHCNILSDTVVL